MSGRFAVVVALCVVPLAVGRAEAQEALPTTPPESVGLTSAGLERLSGHMEGAIEEGRIAGAVVGVARRGGLAYQDAFGLANRERDVPMTDRTLFRIYSMTKAVTAVAVMILHEEGRFELDDPVADYLPEFADVQVLDEDSGELRPPARPVTVRDLLLHTGGLSHRSSQLYRERGVRSRSISLSEFVSNVTSAPLMDDPGVRWRYSASPTVLGALVQVWSGQAFDAFLDERIFGPLGMVDTGFRVEPDRADRLAQTYRSAGGGGLVPYQIEDVPFTEQPALLEGAVGLVSTVPDFLRFSQMLSNGGSLGDVRLLSEETVRTMTSNGLPEAVLARRNGSSGWGLANVDVVLDPGQMSYPTSEGEYRWDGSAGTFFWVDPSRELVVVAMWQNDPYNPGGLAQEVKTLVHEAIVD